jgi:sugar phosphate isomerase/epimerase
VPGSIPESPLSAQGLIDKANQLDVGHLQICDNIVLDHFSNTDLKDLLRYAISKNVQIEVGAKKLSAERLEKYIEISKILKAKILRFVIDDDEYTPSIDETIGIIKDFTSIIEKEGIYLAIENHDRLHCKEYLYILEKTQSDFVRICLDTVNSLGAGEGIETVINILGPFTANIHIKEYAIKRVENKIGFLVEGKPLGEGQLPLAYIFSKLSPLCKTAILEQWVPFAGTLEATIQREEDWAVKSINYLKKKTTYSQVLHIG